MSNVKALTAAEFEEIKNKTGLYLIDFWATWCPPCKAMAPIFDTLSQDSELSDITFFKCDVDDQAEIAELFDIRSIPTFFLVKSKGNGSFDINSDVVQKFTGTKSAFDFKMELQSSIS